MLANTEADIAIVIGGYNSSNSSHLVELCEEKLTTYFIDAADKLIDQREILHRNWRTKELISIHNYLLEKKPLRVLMTSGASCPDAVVEAVIRKLAGFYQVEEQLENYINA